MNEETLCNLLEALRQGRVDPQSVLARLRDLPFERTDTALLDHHRQLRTGIPEAVFGENKDLDQLHEILTRQLQRDQVVLATRVSPDKGKALCQRLQGISYYPVARMLIGHEQWIRPRPDSAAVTVVSAGTSDLPVAEEARLTLYCLGVPTETVHDAGVAGLHRILAHESLLRASGAVIVTAGMEGALPSVVAGLTPAPVIGLPTSIGYGTGTGGWAALLGMLNSCAPGLAVVNIDNGFGAACMAAAIVARR